MPSLRPPPVGARFSIEWGFSAEVNDGTSGDWQEYEEDRVAAAIQEFARHPDLGPAEALVKDIAPKFDADKAETISILTTELARAADSYLEQLKQDVEKLPDRAGRRLHRGRSAARAVHLA